MSGGSKINACEVAYRSHSLMMSKGVNYIKYDLGEVVSKDELLKTGCSWLLQRCKLVRELTTTHWVILMPVELAREEGEEGYKIQVLSLPSSTGLQ